MRRLKPGAEAMRPFTSGSDYVNHIGLEAEEGTDRIRAAFGTNYDRLVDLKNRYDPTNLFRHNQNIKPRCRQRPAPRRLQSVLPRNRRPSTRRSPSSSVTGKSHDWRGAGGTDLAGAGDRLAGFVRIIG